MNMYRGYTRFKTLTVFDDVQGWDLLEILDVQVADGNQTLDTKRFLFGKREPTTEAEFEAVRKKLTAAAAENQELSAEIDRLNSELGVAEGWKADFVAADRELGSAQKLIETQRLMIKALGDDKRAMARLREVFGADAVDEALSVR